MYSEFGKCLYHIPISYLKKKSRMDSDMYSHNDAIFWLSMSFRKSRSCLNNKKQGNNIQYIKERIQFHLRNLNPLL